MIEALQYEFVRNAILAGLLASVACGVVGAYVVVKRIALISGGISHASLGGIGMAYYFGFSPILGALGFSLLSAVIIGWVSLRVRETEDTLIGALWAAGMAIGLIFVQLRPGYAVGLESYLFGNILLVTEADVWRMSVLTAGLLIVSGALYKEFLAVCLDEEFALLRGLPVATLYILLLSMVAVTVVILIQVVGVILLIALLTLPPAIGRWFTERLHTMMIAAVALGAVFTLGGIGTSYVLDFPPGPCIVLLASGCYLAGLAVRGLRASSG